MAVQPSITEHSILQSYLLHPSPLPIILPYTTFLSTCVPAQHRSHPHIKALYRDLQFQRNIDVDTVRQNIERECARAPTLKARLAAKIAVENSHPRKHSTHENGNSRKRRRTNSDSDSDSNSSDDQAEENTKIKSEHEEITDNNDDNLTSRKEIQASTAILESTLHPSAKLNINPNTNKPNNTTTNNVTRHTSNSLLQAMKSAIQSLEIEVSELDSEMSTLLSNMTETVGQLSDLRYGRFARPSGVGSGNGLGIGGEEQEKTMEDDMVVRLKMLEDSVRSGNGLIN